MVYVGYTLHVHAIPQNSLSADVKQGSTFTKANVSEYYNAPPDDTQVILEVEATRLNAYSKLADVENVNKNVIKTARGKKT